MDNLVSAPVLLPLSTAIATLALRGRARGAASLAGGALGLAAALGLLARTAGGGVLVLPLGSWGPASGIVWVVDGLSALMLVAAGIVFLAVLGCARSGWPAQAPPRALQPLLHLLAMGVNGSLLTGDFFNLFVFFEVMLLASFALIFTGGGEGLYARAFPYVLVNLLASALLLGAVGAVYGITGTVNMAALSEVAARGPPSAPLTAAIGLMLAVFAIKAAVVPFFLWLPNSYPAAPLTVTALFAGLLTKVGVYALFRSTPLLFPAPGAAHAALLWLGAGTMALGVLGALGRGSIREILSFHIVSQVGYMAFGLGLGTAAGVAAGLLFTLHNMLVKPALILAGGIAEVRGGTGQLKALGGLSARFWASAAFFVPALALAGLPPLSGFWGKLLLIRAGFASGAWVATGVAVGVSLLTLASMLKIWAAVYWGERRPADGPDSPPAPGERPLLLSALGLAALAVAMGLAIGPLARLTHGVAEQVLARDAYVQAVRGGSPR